MRSIAFLIIILCGSVVAQANPGIFKRCERGQSFDTNFAELINQADALRDKYNDLLDEYEASCEELEKCKADCANTCKDLLEKCEAKCKTLKEECDKQLRECREQSDAALKKLREECDARCKAERERCDGEIKKCREQCEARCKSLNEQLAQRTKERDEARAELNRVTAERDQLLRVKADLEQKLEAMTKSRDYYLAEIQKMQEAQKAYDAAKKAFMQVK